VSDAATIGELLSQIRGEVAQMRRDLSARIDKLDGLGTHVDGMGAGLDGTSSRLDRIERILCDLVEQHRLAVEHTQALVARDVG
jgi:hypothetical protein